MLSIDASPGGSTTSPGSSPREQSGSTPASPTPASGADPDGAADADATADTAAAASADAAGAALASGPLDDEAPAGNPAGAGAQAPIHSSTARQARIRRTLAAAGLPCDTLAMPRRWPLALLLVLGCDDLPPEPTCGPLPDRSACPAERGGSCSDRSCSALYSCKETTWVFVQRCDQNAAGAAGAGAAGAGAAAGAGGTCSGALTDPGGCPSLQSPDCNAAILDACPADACSLGCEAFLRCENNEWSTNYVAYCSDDGELIVP